MSVIGMESFGHAPDGAVTSADLASNVWTTVSGGLSLTDLGGGRKSIKATNGGADMRMAVDSSGITEIIVGFRLHNLSNAPSYLLQFVDGGFPEMGLLQKSGSGQLVYYRSFSPSGGNDVLYSVSNTPVGSDDYWELRVIFHNVAGAVYLYKNGVLDNSVTGIDTIVFGAAPDSIELFMGDGGGGNTMLSDIYVDDADVQGQCDVAYRPVDASGSSADFTPTGAGTNEACVDEIPPDDDTTYNRSTVSTDLDQLGQAGMDGAVGTVLAVQAHIRARKEDATAATIKVGLLHSGTHGQGSAVALSTSYQQFTEIFEDVPGGAGWTSTQFDATEVTYENVS